MEIDFKDVDIVDSGAEERSISALEPGTYTPNDIGFSGGGGGRNKGDGGPGGGGTGDLNGHGGGAGGPKFRELCKLAGATEEQSRLLSRLGSSLSSGKGEVVKAISEQLSSGQLTEKGLREIGNALKNSMDSKYAGIGQLLSDLITNPGKPEIKDSVKQGLAPDGTLNAKDGNGSATGRLSDVLKDEIVGRRPPVDNLEPPPVKEEPPEGLFSRIADQVRTQETAAKFAKLIDDKGKFTDLEAANDLLRTAYRSGNLDEFQNAVNAQLKKSGSQFTFEADARLARVKDIGYVIGVMKSGKDIVSTCGYSITNWFGSDPPPAESEHPKERKRK